MWLNVLVLCSPSGMPATERVVLQEQLIDIILEVLKRNPQLHYYQGYHDVAVTLLLVVGERMAIAMLDTLSNYHLRLFFFVFFSDKSTGLDFYVIAILINLTKLIPFLNGSK